MIIGISGISGSGKDTTANYLASLFMCNGMTARTLAFADAVKYTAAKMFGIDPALFYRRETKEVVVDYWGLSPRQMAQMVGTDMARNVYSDDIWIRRLKKDIDDSGDRFSYSIISDVRFDNEVDFVKSSDGIVIRVERPDLNDCGTASSDHASENGITCGGFDYVIVNDGSLSDFKQKLYEVACRIAWKDLVDIV